MRAFFCTNVVSAAFFTYVHTYKKAAKMTFVQKTRAYNVDEIDYRSFIIKPRLTMVLPNLVDILCKKTKCINKDKIHL